MKKELGQGGHKCPSFLKSGSRGTPFVKGLCPLHRRVAESAESFLIGFNLRALSRGLESIFTENALAFKFYVKT